MASQPTSRMVTRPYSKLTRLCGQATKQGGVLTTFAAVAKELRVTPGRVSQLFGFPQEAVGTVLKGDALLGSLVKAFTADGVACEIEWFWFDYDDFAARVAEPRAGERLAPEPPSADWESREGTVLADLVELRLHPPRPGNEVSDSYYVDATLLFGTAVCDYEPDEGEEPRSVSIALKNARLAIGSDSYRPVPGTMLGEGGRESENYRRVAGGIEITGPAPGGTLDGDPIGDQHLAIIAATNGGPNGGLESFAVSVAALRGSFVVGDATTAAGRPDRDQPVAASVNRNAILNEFIYRRAAGASGRDDAGRVVLAQATMRHRPKPADPA